MAYPRPRRFGLLASLTLLIIGGFTLLIASMAMVLVVASEGSINTMGSTYGAAQLAHARAALLAAATGPIPEPAAVDALRSQLSAARPDLELRVFSSGAPLGDGEPVDEIDRQALAAVRANRGAVTHSVRDLARPDGGGFRSYAPLAGDPDVVVSVRFPLQVVTPAGNRVVIAAALAMGAVMLLTCAGLYLALRRVTRRITRLSAAVSKMANTSDFSTPLPVDNGSDEVADLCSGVRTLGILLRTTAFTLQEASARLSDAGKALTETTGEQTDLLRRHSQAIEEAAVSAEEIRVTSETAAQRAEAVLDAAMHAGELSGSGESAVQKTLVELGEIRSHVQEMSEQIALVAQRAHQISGITQSVKDIADSSNMLALNAAIEAVRSGDQGKGFALVAREMRSLADQSIKATERVREILEDVTVAIQHAADISTRGTLRIETGLGQLTQSGESVRQLAKMVSESSQSARVIAAAVRQQNAGIVQIARSIADQRALTERTSEGLTLTQSHAAALQVLTTQVAELLKSYRV